MNTIFGTESFLPAQPSAGWTLTGSSLLFATAPWDATTYLAIGVLVVVAIISGYIPARRASHIDPLVALRAN